MTPLVPQSAFHLFLHKKRDQIRKEYPQLKEEDLGEIMADVWSSFKPGEKEPYEAEWRRMKRMANEKR